MPKSLLLFLLLLFPLLACAEDQIVSVDPLAGLITVQQKGTLKSFRLKPFTDVTINGLKCTTAQLKAGMQVTLSLADAQTAAKIAARGNSGTAPTQPPPAQNVPGATPAFSTDRSNVQGTRRILLKASIDGDDKFIIEGGKMKIEHGGWQKPKDITVNGIAWKVEWNGKTSDDFIAFQPPLAPFTGANVTVKKMKGRGDAPVEEPPTEANGQKLVIHCKDEGSGASEFEVRITW